MQRLSRSDLLRLQDFLQGLYGLRELPAFRAHVVRMLPRLVRSEFTAYNEVDTRRGVIQIVGDPLEVIQFPDYEQVFSRYIPEHPLISHYARAPDSRVLKISDFLVRTRFHRLALYQEFFRRMGIEFQMACTLPTRSPRIIGVAVNRNRRDFTERERTLFTLARPHLVRAFENAGAFTEVRQTLASAQRALEHTAGAVAVLDREGRPRLITETARRLLADYAADKPSWHGLAADVQRWVGQQRSRLRTLQPPEPLVLLQAGRRLTIRMHSDGDGAMLVLSEWRRTEQPPELEVCGLTPRETEVLQWVARGKANAEIAILLSTSALTIKKHLERIFPKLGVESRTAAALKYHRLTGWRHQ